MIVLQSIEQGWHYTSLFGMIVGWLLLTYGVVIWGANAYSHIPSRYGFMFGVIGLALMLINNRLYVHDPVQIMFLKFLGNLIAAIIGTLGFMWLQNRQLSLPDVEDPDAPHGD